MSVSFEVSPVASPSGPTAAVERRQHRNEYRSVNVWLWRRAVGAAFALVMISVGWYLVKVPDGLVGDDRLPSQSQVVAAFFALSTEPVAGANLGGHLGASLARLVTGMTIGLVAGALAGVAAGTVPSTRTVVDPVVSFLRAVPPVAIAPFVLVWFGPGDATPTAVAAGTTMWAVAASTGEVRIRDLRRLPADLVTELTLGMRTAVRSAWAAVLAVETIMSPTGLGPLVWSSQGRTDVVVAVALVAGVVGWGFDSALRTLHYLTVGSLVGGTPRGFRADTPGSDRDRVAVTDRR